jgi:hypothetical protein
VSLVKPKIVLCIIDALSIGSWIFILAAGFFYLALLVQPQHFTEVLEHQPGQFMDFLVYYSSGKMINAGQGNWLYDSTAQNTWYHALTGVRLPASYLPYPPFFTLISWPLTFLPVNFAYLLWSVFSIAVATAGLFCLAKGYPRWHYLAFWAGLMASVPTWRCLILGQTSLLFLGLVSFFVVAIRQRRDILAGVILAILSLKPQFSIYLFVLALAMRKWKILLSFALGLAVLFALSSVTVGWNVILEYPKVCVKIAQASPQSFYVDRMISLRGFFTQLLPQSYSNLLSYVGSGLGLLGVFLIVGGVRDEKNNRLPWIIAMTVMLYLVTGPHAHLYDAILLAVPACILNLAVGLSGMDKLDNNAARVAAAIIYFYPGLSWLSFVSFAKESALFFDMFFFLNLSLLVLMCRLRPAQPVLSDEQPK